MGGSQNTVVVRRVRPRGDAQALTVVDTTLLGAPGSTATLGSISSTVYGSSDPSASGFATLAARGGTFHAQTSRAGAER
jgi:hypothetical protein